MATRGIPQWERNLRKLEVEEYGLASPQPGFQHNLYRQASAGHTVYGAAYGPTAVQPQQQAAQYYPPSQHILPQNHLYGQASGHPIYGVTYGDTAAQPQPAPYSPPSQYISPSSWAQEATHPQVARPVGQSVLGTDYSIEERADNFGRVYFFNRDTGKTGWSREEVRT